MTFRWCLVALAVVAGLGGAGTVRADHAPAIAIPGNPDVPVIINGQNATGATVVGDWGLYRIAPAQKTLEDVFVHLTRHEEGG